MYHVDSEKVIWRVVDGEVVIVHARTAEYYGTNQSGAVLWTRIVEGAAGRNELAETLRNRFELSAEDAASAADAFVDRALAADLITEGAVAGGPAGDVVEVPDAPFELPSLVRFGDLDALVLSGE